MSISVYCKDGRTYDYDHIHEVSIKDNMYIIIVEASYLGERLMPCETHKFPLDQIIRIVEKN